MGDASADLPMNDLALEDWHFFIDVEGIAWAVLDLPSALHRVDETAASS